MKKVLNVGGNNKSIKLPSQYDGWENILLDIDPRGSPDIVCDARELLRLPRSEYDAIYCSHNLEHYYRHDVRKVLSGFLHVLKEGGFVHIRVPDIGQLMRIVVQKSLDIDDFLYQSPAGPITVGDIIYGYGKKIEHSGNDFFAHKSGFTQKSLSAILATCGFSHVFVRAGNLEIAAFAFRDKPDAAVRSLLNLPAVSRMTSDVDDAGQRVQPG